MADNKKYSKDNIPKLTWPEHMRSRPSMYLGQVNLKGFVEHFKGILSDALYRYGAHSITFDFRNDTIGTIILDESLNPVIDDWSKNPPNPENPFVFGFRVLNALSTDFKVEGLGASGESLFKQTYKAGERLNGEDLLEAVHCKTLIIDFELDKAIWGEEFSWSEAYINHTIREFAYLHKAVKFKLLYEMADEPCQVIYYFENGLKDRLDIEKLKGLGNCYFETHLDTKLKDFHVEAAFAFRNYTVDEPFLKSFVNDYCTQEHGSHIDGLLKGLTYGVMRYFQKNNLTESYKISEKGMRENLVGLLNIRMKAPVFSGCVKNKLANPEIIEPIANYIAGVLFDKIEGDQESTEKLIRKFSI